uniref:glycosyltransferase family A protein n=1 Tax=Pantoea sp. IMH TaxID=1267600 RepID=UPI0004686654|nr:glycosyltransferase family A protein [Pantoea sp. IMH]
MTLDILISTFGKRLPAIENIILPKNDAVHYYICHQNPSLIDNKLDFLNREDVTYIASETIGVTKSRNILIKRATADIVYFCDDDVLLRDDIYNLLVSQHQKFSDDVILFSIKDEYGRFRKKYPNGVTKKNKMSILSVGTIEISMKNRRVPEFPEDMGAGSTYPIGDEAVFLAKVLAAKGTIVFVPETIAFHPMDSTGMVPDAKSIIARGITLKRVYGNLAPFLAIIFFIRRRNLFKIPQGYIESMKLLIKGVVQG